MLRIPLSPSLSNLRAEHGISMIELLVAMAAATVVTAAIVTVLQVAYNQETRTTDHTQANQIARTAMNSIVTELNSSCTGRAPIQYIHESEILESPTISGLGLKPIGPLNLWLISVYGSESGEAVLKTAKEQDISWTETGTSKTSPQEKLGKLIDYEFASEGGSPTDWTFGLKNPKKRLLAENVIPLEVNKTQTIFQYARYKEGKLITDTPNSKETAEQVSKVEIGFKQAAEDGDTREGHTVTLSDAVNLRLDPSEESISEGPCE